MFGRDFTGTVTAQGGADQDSFLGTVGADTLIGGGGNDILFGAGGSDVLLGGAGDDLLIWNAASRRVDGGGNSDTLRVSGGDDLDLTTVRHRLFSIERLDASNSSGENLITLDGRAVRDITDGQPLLTVAGGDEDTVALTGQWQADGEVLAGFARYSQHNLKVDIASASTVMLNGVIDLASLNGSNGFRLNGVDATDSSGVSISSAGDFNGDGRLDLLIGAQGAHPVSASVGAAWVVFGQSDGFAATTSLGGAGMHSLRLDGAVGGDFTGASVSAAGDMNGDGFGDLIIGAYGADPHGTESGSSYIVYGSANADNPAVTSVSLTDVAARIDGVFVTDQSGRAVAGAGDFDGDGFDDLLIGARFQDINGTNNGAVHLLRGHASAIASTAVTDLPTGDLLRFNGVASFDSLGAAVSTAGDFNGDGFADILLGANTASRPGVIGVGAGYLIFGAANAFASSASQPAQLDGAAGFRMIGVNSGDGAGSAVSSAGDINGDGYSDLMIAAPFADPNGVDSGSVYVVYGGTSTFAGDLDLANINGSNGFRLDGGVAGAHAGAHLAAAGDVNADGFDDVLVAVDANGVGSGASVYLVFGSNLNFGSDFNLAGLGVGQGIRFDGIGADAGSQFASVAAAGDLNGDGYDDFMIGDGRATVGALANAGSTYVVYGRDFNGLVTLKGVAAGSTLTGTSADEILVGGQGDDVLDGGAGVDVLRGGAGNDTLVWDALDRRVDGGDGTDTVRIDGSGVTLDLTAVTAERLSGIEIIDLTGSGNNQLHLALSDVLTLGEGNSLRINGNIGDSLELDHAEQWVFAGNPTVDGKLYIRYAFPDAQHLNAVLLLEQGVGSNFPGF